MPVDGVTRRITRDMNSSKLVEDLWVGRSTAARLLSRELRHPLDMHVQLDVDAVIEECGELPWEERPTSSSEQTKFRGTAARINFLACDRPDLQYASKESSRKMSNPCNGDWALLKRMARYLVSHRRLIHFYAWQDASPTVSVYTDSNWAGCTRTRKSTSGACLFHGEHLVRSYAKTQAVIALSSAEAELYATTMASSEALGLKAMMADFGIHVTPHMFVDASAAIGICQRKGLGKVRHLDTQSLWIQDALRQKRLELSKVKGTENPSDAMTKFLDGVILTKMLGLMNCRFEEGRADSTPHLAVDVSTAILTTTTTASSEYPASIYKAVRLKAPPSAAVTRPPPLPAAALEADPLSMPLPPPPPQLSSGSAAQQRNRHPGQAVSTVRFIERGQTQGIVTIHEIPASGLGRRVPRRGHTEPMRKVKRFVWADEEA